MSKRYRSRSQPRLSSRPASQAKFSVVMQICQIVHEGSTVYSKPCSCLVALRGRPRLAARRSPARRNATCFAQSRSSADLKAVVIGSGFAGLSAAAGLSKRFKDVASATKCSVMHAMSPYLSSCVLQTLLERDSIPFDISPEDASELDTGRQRYEVCFCSRLTLIYLSHSYWLNCIKSTPQLCRWR